VVVQPCGQRGNSASSRGGQTSSWPRLGAARGGDSGFTRCGPNRVFFIAEFLSYLEERLLPLCDRGALTPRINKRGAGLRQWTHCPQDGGQRRTSHRPGLERHAAGGGARSITRAAGHAGGEKES